MTIDLDVLQTAAEAATPGPWVRLSTRSIESDAPHMGWPIVVDQLNDGVGAGVIEVDDATFIAAANPAVVLELLAAHRAALARIARVEALHYEDEHVCAECSVEGIPEHSVRGVSVPWPCPTVQALTDDPVS